MDEAYLLSLVAWQQWQALNADPPKRDDPPPPPPPPLGSPSADGAPRTYSRPAGPDPKAGATLRKGMR